MRSYFLLCSVLFISGLLAEEGAESFSESFRGEVSSFLDSLSEEQEQSFLWDLDEKREGGRWQMRYTGGERLGVKLGELSAPQYSQVEGIIKMILSDHGYEMAHKVMAQDGEEAWRNYYISCFGDPRGDDVFAFRFGEHHVNVVYLEVAEGELREFGPMLWGSDPPDLWLEEEKDLMVIWQSLSEDEKEKVLIKGEQGIASKPLKGGQGVTLSSLNEESQEVLNKMMVRRLSVFSTPLRRCFLALQMDSGREEARLAFYHEAAEQACRDGGRWDFKLGTERVNTDFENSRGHIHMSMWVKQDE